jgi:hypothetical protein
MGNQLSIVKPIVDATKECIFCQQSMDAINVIYFDLVCAKCQQRCKGDCHNHCMNNYQKSLPPNSFLCIKCNHSSNL